VAHIGKPIHGWNGEEEKKRREKGQAMLEKLARTHVMSFLH
jgi:hypothetical protein